MKQMILITVLLIGYVRPEFIPGCSFYNGQCSYTVQLGHQGQCNLPTTAQNPSDFPTTVQPPTTCCTNLQTDIADLRSLVAGLTNDLKLLKDNYNVLENETNELNTTTSNKDDLLQLLQTKEAEFNKTHDQIAAVLQQASAEIHRLRDELVATTRQLNNCRGTLGLQSGTATVAPVLDASINMTFCDFQTSSESCGFNTNRKTGYSWKSHSGSINSLTGPIEDHTYGSQKGVYMYMDTDNSPYGDHVIRTYRMESNLISPAAAVCVRFWYNMNGKDIRTLNIYAKIGNGDGYPVWTQSGNQGQRWSLGEVSLDSEYTASHFKIVVEGTTDSYHTSYNHYNEHGDIAFDDFYIYNTSCNSE
ncbi:hypothetical protein SNE40_016256 [Patella caerulea]|uniref:MAM domain-containing protein n=1 Tax=Patella caerulea TaxID=87958 RepID=A0AAN8JAZ1_PATCE